MFAGLKICQTFPFEIRKNINKLAICLKFSALQLHAVIFCFRDMRIQICADMKRVAIVLLLPSWSFFCGGQALSSVEKVDSFFNTNLEQLGGIAKNKNLKYSTDNVAFIYLMTFLSDEGAETYSYSGYPKRVKMKKIKSWKKWYSEHKEKINWEQHVEEGMRLIQQGPPMNESDLERYLEQLDKLKIE